MITWRYVDGSLTWQGSLLLFCALYLIGTGLLLAYQAWQRHRTSAWRRAWRREQIESDSRDTTRYFRNIHRN
jgi:hypothetical protein